MAHIFFSINALLTSVNICKTSVITERMKQLWQCTKNIEVSTNFTRTYWISNHLSHSSSILTESRHKVSFLQGDSAVLSSSLQGTYLYGKPQMFQHLNLGRNRHLLTFFNLCRVLQFGFFHSVAKICLGKNNNFVDSPGCAIPKTCFCWR